MKMDSNLSDFDVSHLSEDQKNIAECIGLESYYKLTQHYGGSSIYVARPNTIDKQKRNRMIINDFNKGASYKELALKYGLTTIWVRNIVNGKT